MSNPKWIIVVASLLLAGCWPQNPDQMEASPLQSTPQEIVAPTLIDGSSLINSASPNPSPATVAGIINQPSESIPMNQATITTAKGQIVLQLFPDLAPKTVANFTAKASSHYYDGLIFHRVEDWVVQGGDPLGNGTGGGKMPTELSKTPFKTGSLGVARGGDIQISNDSQFFICTTDCDWLTGQYTLFGEVTQGMEVVKALAIGDKITSIKVE